MARTAIRPTVRAGLTLQRYWDQGGGDLDLTGLIDALSDQIKAVNDNDLSRCEAALTAQVHTLDAMFNAMAIRASNNLGHYPETVERYLKLALKAQSQCRTTIEALAMLKRPPVSLKQTNIAHGHQQINNASRTGETTSTKTLEDNRGERLELGETQASIGHDPALEAVGAVNGTENA